MNCAGCIKMQWILSCKGFKNKNGLLKTDYSFFARFILWTIID